MERMRVKANGVELEVNQYPKNGQTVVFLHFSSGNLAQWNGIVPYFIDKYHVVTLDLRGHGKSEKPKIGYTIDNMARDVIGVMDKLEIDRAHIVGSSLGGEIAASLAANFPERILSIVAEGAIQNYFGKNGVRDIPEDEIPNKKVELRARERVYPVYNSIAEKTEDAKQSYKQGGIKWSREVEEFEIYNTTETEDGKYTDSCPKWVMEAYLEDFWDIKFENYFERIGCPVLMLPSEDEWKTQSIKAGIENFQRLLNVNKVALIHGGSHAYVAFQYPEELSNEILGFYKEIKVIRRGCKLV